MICDTTIVMNWDQTMWSFKCPSNTVIVRQLMRGYCKEKKLKKVQVKKSMPAVICKWAFPVTTQQETATCGGEGIV